MTRDELINSIGLILGGIILGASFAGVVTTHNLALMGLSVGVIILTSWVTCGFAYELWQPSTKEEE